MANLADTATGYAEAFMASPDTAPAQLQAAAQDVADQAGVIAANNPWVRRRPLNISHRGGENDWPENTMYAYAESIRRAGSDMIEMDIYETADGELVVIHNSSVDNTTNGSGSVSSFTLAQIQALDAAYWFAQDGDYGHGTHHSRPASEYIYRGIATGARPAPAGYGPEDFRIPTLRQIFENPRFDHVFINIELKPDPDSTGQYEAKLAAMIREYGRQDDVMVASFLDHNAALFKANAPEIATSVPTAQAAVDKSAGGVPFAPDNTHPGVGLTVGHKAFQVPMTLEAIPVITAEYVADAHARGMAVHAWTINDRADMIQLLNWCVDGIMSDKPLLLEDVLQGNEWSCPLDAPTGGQLQHFIGSLHEHSGFSDGEIGTSPADYFQAGIDNGLDFIAGSEHSDNAMAPVTANADCLSDAFPDCIQASPDGVQKWSATATIADAKNAPGRFSAIRGFEWTSDRFGHINVFFSQNDLNAKTGTGYAVALEDFWQWLALPPAQHGGADGLAVFNHPGREATVHGPLTDAGLGGDPAYTWNDFAYRPEHDARMVGIEMYGKGGDYYDSDHGAPAGGWYAYALDKGWHVAAVGAEDEHGRSWAKPQRAKTVMLARENTRAALRDAMASRRFYALAHGHGDIRLDFSANDKPMGSRLSDVDTVSFYVAVSDLNAANGVAATQIQVVGPGGTVLETAGGLSHAFDATAGAQEQWRFVRVLDASGKVLAVSAPIWFTGVATGGDDPHSLPLCGDTQVDGEHCVTELDAVVPGLGTLIQQWADTIYDAVSGGGGELPPVGPGPLPADPYGLVIPASDEIDTASTGGKVYQIYLPSEDNGEVIAFSVFEPAQFDGTDGNALVLQGHGYGLKRSHTPDGPAGDPNSPLPTSGAQFGYSGGLIGDMTQFVAANFWVISIDQRGFGESEGTVRLMDPDHEGRNLLQILDWAEAHLPHLMYRAEADHPNYRDGRNLVLGSTGGSYGGAYQNLILAIDPKERLDAMVPQITWHDLSFSLAAGDVTKSGYALGLAAAGEASSRGRQDPFVREQLIASGLANRATPELKEALRYHSLKYWCDGGFGDVASDGLNDEGIPFRAAKALPKVDVLLFQGMHDALFNISEAIDSYDCLKARGGDVRLYTYQFGHVWPSGTDMFSATPVSACSGPDCLSMFGDYSGGGMDSAMTCGPYKVARMELDWMKAKLQGDAAATATLASAPATCVELDSTADAVTLGANPRVAPLTTVPIPATNVVLNGTQAQPVPVKLITLNANNVLAGIPKATITLSTPSPVPPQFVDEVGVSEPIVFVGLARGRFDYASYCHQYADSYPFAPMVFCTPVETVQAPLADFGLTASSPSHFELIDDQIMPIRGLGTHEIDLQGVGERLARGEQINLVIYGYHPLYVVSGSRQPATLPLQVSGSVRLPLQGNLPRLQ